MGGFCPNEIGGKTVKKLLSLILSIVLVFTISVPAYAASAQSVTDHDPVVLIRGMDFGNVMLNPETDEQTKANDFSVSTILSAVFNSSIITRTIKNGKDGTVDALIDVAYSLLKYNSMSETGDPLYNTGMVKYTDSVDYFENGFEGTNNEMGMLRKFTEEFEEDHIYYVNYDWRIDPYLVADEINDAVELAIRNTGHSKVSLVCSSMGGIMTVAYLSKYGYENIGRCLFLSSTFCGSQIISDVLNGRVEITADRLYDWLYNFSYGNSTLRSILTFVYKIGLFDSLTKITDYILINRKDDVYDKVLKPIFVYSPCIWGLIADDTDYEDAIKYIFGSRENVNPTFLNRIDALHDMMNNRNDLLNEMVESGVRVNVVSNYGSPLIPVYASASWSGDRILEAYNTSGFATVAKFGETLGDGYTAENAELISPDNCVDLSTAVLPEYTYMIKEAPHVASSYGTEYLDFVVFLLENTDDCKAGSNEKYPQFMVSDLNEQTLAPF